MPEFSGFWWDDEATAAAVRTGSGTAPASSGSIASIHRQLAVASDCDQYGKVTQLAQIDDHGVVNGCL